MAICSIGRGTGNLTKNIKRKTAVAHATESGQTDSMISRAQMLRAMQESNREYDGRFYVGVKTTGIYCLPSCGARKPKPENVEFFPTRDSAQKAGLRACMRCRPEQNVPLYDQEMQHMMAVAQKIRENPAAYIIGKQLELELKCKTTKLNKLFKTYFQVPPGEFVSRAQLDKAAQLLESKMSVGEVALELGYENPSSFSEAFKLGYLISPSQYSKLGAEFQMAFPSPFNKAAWLKYLRREPASLTLKFEGRKFTFGCAEGWVEFEVLHVGVRVKCLQGDPYRLYGVMLRLLGAFCPSRQFESWVQTTALSAIVRRNPGLRIYQTSDLWEAMVWAVVGQQVNLTFAGALRSALAQAFGDCREGIYRIPGPKTVAALSVEQLLELRFSRQKALYLIGIAEWFTTHRNDLENAPHPLALGTLLSLKGIGEWSANYILMRGLGFCDVVPIGDTGLTSGLLKALRLEKRPQAVETRKLMEKFAPYRSLATFHLWYQ